MQFNLCPCVLLWEGGTCQPTRSWSCCLITCIARHVNWVRGTGTESWTSKQRIWRIFYIKSSRDRWWNTFKEENILFWVLLSCGEHPSLSCSHEDEPKWLLWSLTFCCSPHEVGMFGTIRWIGTNIHGQPVLTPSMPNTVAWSVAHYFKLQHCGFPSSVIVTAGLLAWQPEFKASV